jgi:hypothetical protein
MIFLDTNPLHYNTRIYFKENIMPNLPHDETAWYNGYRSWLAEQGCEIIKHEPELLGDGLGVSTGYDRFGFANEQDATLFLLRWS